jgi:hypothetical protein
VGGKQSKQGHETEDVDKAVNEPECDRKGDMLECRGDQIMLGSFGRGGIHGCVIDSAPHRFATSRIKQPRRRRGTHAS